MAVGGGGDDPAAIMGVHGRVHIGRVPTVLLQSLPRLQTMGTRGVVEGGCQDLRRVLGPRNEGDAFVVRLLVPPDALACRHSPDLQLTVLGASRQQLGILRKGNADHCLFVHHEGTFLLVREVLSQHRRLVIPDLDEAVHRARDAILPVGRERRTLGMRLRAELDSLGDLCRALLALLDGICCHPSENIDPRVRGQDARVLLPLHGLADQRQQPRRRRHLHVLADGLRYGAALLLLGVAVIGLPWIEVVPLEQGLEAQISLGRVLLHGDHGCGLPNQMVRRVELPHLGQLEDDLDIQVLLHVVW
mmetsp:Transcript_125156/g.400894  ORF Transcript_125156/g.400894 Transcript_125156/m.400894 type:complete len:304 (-) Transcript_125156:323-1234(-)